EASLIDENYQPITFATNAPANVTQPHGFDREMVPPLDALWFALHLPRRVHDTLDLPLAAMRKLTAFDLAHRITLFPSPLMARDEWRQRLAVEPPALVITPDTIVQDADTFAAAIGVRLDV